jgi:vacuolar-type H+-ATPase subunit F/Vma7
MSRIAAIGEQAKLAGYALAGVELIEADAADRVREAWEQLGAHVGLVLLTPEARQALPDQLHRRGLLWVVLPA